MRGWGAAAMLLALTGCALSSTGVIAQGDDLYRVAIQGKGFSNDAIRASAVAEARRFCDRRARTLAVVDARSLGGETPERWPESDVVFRCD